MIERLSQIGMMFAFWLGTLPGCSLLLSSLPWSAAEFPREFAAAGAFALVAGLAGLAGAKIRRVPFQVALLAPIAVCCFACSNLIAAGMVHLAK